MEGGRGGRSAQESSFVLGLVRRQKIGETILTKKVVVVVNELSDVDSSASSEAACMNGMGEGELRLELIDVSPSLPSPPLL